MSQDNTSGPVSRFFGSLARFFARADSSPDDRPNSAAVGRAGEKRAKRILKKAGLRILAANYRCPVGEVDLLAWDRRENLLVVVEVKTRTRDTHVQPYSAVNANKQRRLKKIADYYLASRPSLNGVRFDIVSIVFPDGNMKNPRTEHLIDAF